MGAGAAGDGGSGGDRDVLPGRRTRQDLIGSRWIRFPWGNRRHGSLGIVGVWDLALARFRLLAFAFASLQIEFVQTSELQCTASAILHG